MNLAYFITAYKHPRQFHWLFQAIYSQDDIFLIHVDRKAPKQVHYDVRAICGDYPNVHFMASEVIAWGGWSLSGVTLKAIRTLLSLDESWQYFLNLSAQDYPIKRTEYIRTELQSHEPQCYVQMRRISEDNPDLCRHFRRRLRWRCFEHHGRLVRTPIPLVPPKGLNIVWRGSFWVILSREFCDWVTHDDFVQQCGSFLRHVKIPDEFLFQTLVSNSPNRSSVISDNKREIVWTGQPGPKVLTMQDYQRLLSSRAFFARKFDETIDHVILSRLAEDIGAARVE